MSGRKDDKSKLRMDLIPVSALHGLAEVLTFGANKYDDRNWEKGLDWSRVYGAALRHLTKWWSGEDLDTESGLNHLNHVLCCISFLVEYTQTHKDLDDRPGKGNFTERRVFREKPAVDSDDVYQASGIADLCRGIK